MPELAPRPSADLRDKVNVIASLVRKQEATAEDFKEISDILEWFADWVDGQEQPEGFYKFHTSIAVLQAAYPDAPEDSFAIIVPDNGNTPFIAIVANGVWVGTQSEAPIQYANNKVALEQNDGQADVLYIVKDEKLIALWFNNQYNYFGKDGNNGLSTYQIAVALGFQGTEQEWIDSIKESLDFVWDGDRLGVKKTADGVFVYSDPLTGPEGPEGPPGPPGPSFKDETTAATSKPTPVDADVFGFLDSAAAFVIKKFTWANLKASLKTYFDTIYAPISGGTPAPEISYETVAELLSDQANQVEGKEYTVRDASGWSTISHNGWATFEKKATSTASEEDYEEREQEDFDGIGAIKTGDIKLDNVAGNIYGDASELTGNITIDDNFNRLGGVALVYHKDNVAPTITTSLKKTIIPVGGSYIVNESNLISLSVIGDNKLGIVYSQLTANSVDTENPTPPTNLSTSNYQSDSFTADWDDSTDNIAVTGYDAELNGTLLQDIGFAPVSFNDLANLVNSGNSVEGLELIIRFRSKDAAGNLSPYTPSVSAYMKYPTPEVGINYSSGFDEVQLSSNGTHPNADNWVIERATQANFSDAQVVATITDNVVSNFNDDVSGLADGIYYYRTKFTDNQGLHPDSDYWTGSADISGANTAPTDMTLSANSVAEDAANDTVVGAFTATDTEGGGMTYSIVSQQVAGAFKIVGNELQVADNTKIVYANNITLTVTVRVTDYGGLTYDEQFSITVNEATSTGIASSVDSLDTTPYNLIPHAGDVLLANQNSNECAYFKYGSFKTVVTTFPFFTNSFTIHFEIKVVNLTSGPANLILNAEGTPTNDIRLDLRSSGNFNFAYGSSFALMNSNVLNSGMADFVTVDIVVSNGSKVEILIDNVAQSKNPSFDYVINLGSFSSGGKYMTIGRSFFDEDPLLDAYIRNFAIIDLALSSQQRSDLISGATTIDAISSEAMWHKFDNNTTS